jgi:hypothetical protein
MLLIPGTNHRGADAPLLLASRCKGRHLGQETGEPPDSVMAQAAPDRLATECSRRFLHEGKRGWRRCIAMLDDGDDLAHVTPLQTRQSRTTMFDGVAYEEGVLKPPLE